MHVAFLGLGNMGRPMALNLRKAGHEVRGFDPAPAARKGFAQAGGVVAADARAALTDADAVVTMLPAGKHVRATYLDADGILTHARGALLIDSSTIDVATAREVSAAAERAGFDMVDAPVSGGVGGAEAATLTFMVGGSDAAFTRAAPLLRAMGRTIVHAGAAGAGQAAKLCNNMLLGIGMIGAAEALVLADRLGLERQKLFDIVKNSSGACWSLTNYCPAPGPVPTAPSNRDYAAGFAVNLMLKDLTLAQDAASRSGAATPLGAHAARLYEALAEAGEGSRDFSVIYRWLAGATREAVP
jgi:3-hydroxyisobutyrate dehydrogenase